jgi:flagellar biosynthetic protein FliR
MTLTQFLPANLFAVLLVFARIGSALMLLPGFGDLYVPLRYRLLLAVLFSFLLAGIVAPALPPLPSSPAVLLAILFGEIIIGAFLGTTARIVLSALETAGMIISLQLGLSAAQVFNPTAAQQGSLTGTLMTMLGVLMIFATDTHHMMFRALVDSYALMSPGSTPIYEDMADLLAHMVAASFRLGLEIAAPLIVLGTVFYVAMGLVSRLMPQLQIFFLAVPIQILGGVLLFAFTLSAVMNGFLGGFVEGIGQFVLP